jgi:hypothetical protein
MAGRTLGPYPACWAVQAASWQLNSWSVRLTSAAMTRIERTILLNQVAQSVRRFDDITRELAIISETERVEWLSDLIFAVGQSHPTPADVEAALAASGLKLTYTPCVLLRSKPLRDALAKIRQLPTDETEKSFRALTSVLSVSDARRRVACGSGCQHWWHKDLGDVRVVNELLAHDGL